MSCVILCRFILNVFYPYKTPTLRTGTCPTLLILPLYNSYFTYLSYVTYSNPPYCSYHKKRGDSLFTPEEKRSYLIRKEKLFDKKSLVTKNNNNSI